MKPTKAEKKNKAVDFKIFLQLSKFLKPYKSKFLVLVFLTISLALLGPVRPYLIQKLLDNEVANNDSAGLLKIILLLVCLLLSQSFVQYKQAFSSQFIGDTIIRDIRSQLFKHIIKFKLKFYEKNPVGLLITRTISDTETLANIFSQSLTTIIAEILQLIVVLALMFSLNVKLTLVSLAAVPFLILATYVFKEKIKYAFEDVRNAVAKLNSFVQEHIKGMAIVQIFNSEDKEYEKFKEINKSHMDANIQSVLYYSIYFPIIEILSTAALGLLIWYGTEEIFEGNATPGVIIAFIMYISMFYRPIKSIGEQFNTLQLGIVSASRVLELLNNKEFAPEKGCFKKEDMKGDIEFNKVSFAYDKEKYILHDINLKIKEGESVALVGPTGAGKSSIINLLGRFYDIQKGEILIDEVNIKEYELKNLRKQVGIVLQDVFLFSDTIRKNITLGDESITDETIKKTAKMIGADRFINKLPRAYDYHLAERGVNLSLGQRQLISFIRAMVYNPKIIVLDEATSSVDSETEELIQEAIEKMMLGRTTIIIAHRLSTIQKADKIVVLKKGKIEEKGTHEELLNLGGIYKRLYEIQFKHEIKEPI